MPRWGVDIKDDKTRNFIRSLDPTIKNEIGLYFLRMARVFDKANRQSTLCTSGLMNSEKYSVKGQKLIIEYHIDNNERMIRITGYSILK